MFVQSNMFNNGRIGAKVKKLRFTPAQVELFDKKMLNTWLWNKNLYDADIYMIYDKLKRYI